MTHTAINIIKGEHRSLGAVLHALQHLVREARQGGVPDFPLIDAILQYIEEFPRRVHHPKEDDYLFKMLRARTSEADAILDELGKQHIGEADMLREMHRLLQEYKDKGTPAAEPFARMGDDYANFQWRHMTAEENQIMTLAEQKLTEVDWKKIDRAFQANDDPLFGQAPREEFQKLFKFIVTRLPSPYGYGSGQG